jgi:hypothetical protein
MWPSVVVHEHWLVSQRIIVEIGDYAWSEHIVTLFLACQITIKNVQDFTINAVDILVIDFYALHIRTVDAFKSSENLKTLHFNAMLKICIKDKLVLRFSSAF